MWEIFSLSEPLSVQRGRQMPGLERLIRESHIKKDGQSPVFHIYPILCHHMIAGIHVNNFACDSAGQIAQQECDCVAHFKLVDVPLQR